MEVCCNVSQLASGDWTLVTCCASFYMCIAIVCTCKQIHRPAPPGGRLVFSFLAVSVLLHLLSSTVGAAKPRHFRDATASVWAEGNPQSTSGHAMAAGPDGSLWVFGGIISSPQVAGTFVNDLFKLDLDTKEWHLIEPRGSVKPSARSGHSMVSVGSDLYVFGGGGVRVLTRMTSFGSRRRSRSGSSSMRHGSRVPRRARDPVTAWWPWGATSTCSEEGTISRQLTRMTSFGSRQRSRSGSKSMRHGSRAPRRAGNYPITVWWPWGATSTCSEVELLTPGGPITSFGSRRRNRSGSSSMRHGSRVPRRVRDPVTAWCP